MNQEVSGGRFDKGVIKAVVLTAFKQPVKFRFFQRVVWVVGKTVFGTEYAKIAQSCVVEGSRHIRKAQVVKNLRLLWMKEGLINRQKNLQIYCLVIKVKLNNSVIFSQNDLLSSFPFCDIASN